MFVFYHRYGFYVRLICYIHDLIVHNLFAIFLHFYCTI